MFKNFSEEAKYEGFKSILEKHNNNVDAVIEYGRQRGYYSEKSKIAYLKKKLINIINQEVSNFDYYKENMYLLQEIRQKINFT